MDYKNYISLKKFSLRFRHFCFIDTDRYLADALFIKHKVRVWFKQEAHKEGTDFVFIFCKVRKKDVDKFLTALDELKGKMLLMGCSEYQEFCEECEKMFR